MGRLLGFVVLVVLLSLIVIVVLRARDFIADRAQRSLTGGGQRQQALEEAREQLRRAEKAYDKSVRRARKQVVEAGRDPVLAKVGPVILGACTVTLQKKVYELSPSTVFRVDVEGEIKQQVLTRRGGEEKVVRDDQREVFLTITDDAWGDVVKLPPTQLEGARRLEVAGAGAIRNLRTAQDERDARVLAAQAQLERAMAQTAEVDAARMTLEDLEGAGPRRIDVPEPPPWTADDDPPGGPDDDEERPGGGGTTT